MDIRSYGNTLHRTSKACPMHIHRPILTIMYSVKATCDKNMGESPHACQRYKKNLPYPHFILSFKSNIHHSQPYSFHIYDKKFFYQYCRQKSV